MAGLEWGEGKMLAMSGKGKIPVKVHSASSRLPYTYYMLSYCGLPVRRT
jgi:hypothetical protein